ncbi:MAG TPA: LysR family transcriptional regulator substrate-binding protein [Candidatus Agrococcus pullicola]|uniref:LysR family transcriptional regulator substrate-binding protein n=1 Tax=Candidatus Agrococcus pullicola TaxID=2838429 RepID=A0A9D1YX52_9MICO|nr:LysR family transcriptional regulator substrate-binding protein [Candidatus Agrococcus pullicola]
MAALRIRYVEGVNPSRWFTVWDERHPDSPLDQRRVPESEQFDDVIAGDADLAIVRGEATDARLHRVRLFEERAVAVAMRDHPIEAFDEINLSDLDGEHLIDIDALSAEDAAAVAATGAGIAILPMSVARLYGRKDAIARPVVDVPGYEVALVWLRDRDDDGIQDFVGITRGRRAASSRGSDSADAEPVGDRSREKRKQPLQRQQQRPAGQSRPRGPGRKPSRPRRRR